MAAHLMLNQSTRIGMAAMAALAEASGTNSPALTAARIARLRSVPPSFLAKILTALSRAGLIRSARGPGGGYVLARPPAAISMLDIVICFEPVTARPLCPLGRKRPCRRSSPCPLHVPFQKLWQAQADFLAQTTLAGFAVS
jgi:Rrf2 family iron-sulfur cluster assembly transcriptional regulator